MTCYPRRENAFCWWLTTRRGWHRLHAVREADLTVDDHREAVDWAEPLTRTTVCGRELALAYPGLFSRFGMTRCAHCCKALSIPQGCGSPINEAAEKRLANTPEEPRAAL